MEQMNAYKMKKPFIPSWIFEQGFPARHVAVLCYVASRGKCLASQATIGKALHIERGDVVSVTDSTVYLDGAVGLVREVLTDGGGYLVVSIQLLDSPLARAG